ncbi:zinc-ribbon domain-containing protein [Roseovarius mucosus]|uniref:zinc-ribbon domain-containing protein n=1 Tax=Roseovarius mucosus TaxID=215743 RepID=UPI0035CEBFBF|tara:strand:+ start:536 stop:1390 length:855 start_codon:yes stop_codon:yes gene_type:complete
MRLICPNCGAQYEVPDEVIPLSGRDVQCSNCGDTWFQHHASHAPDASGDDDLGPPPREEDVPPPAPPVTEDLSDAPYEDDEYDDDLLDEDFAEPEPAPARPARRGIDPGVADILRQEAERERQVRSAPGGIEMQPDLGLTEPELTEDERTRQARARMERLRGTSGPSAPTAPEMPDAHASIDPSSRRNLLPDIEEINSSLTSTGDRADPAQSPMPEDIELPVGRGGFRSGFRLAIITFGLAALVYALAPRLAASIPAAEAPLTQYVRAVNMARVWLDQLVGGWF